MTTRILMLATGDTMAHARRGDTPVVLTGAELLATAGPPPPGTEVDVRDLTVGPSWDLDSGDQLTLARRVRAGLLDDGHDAVVLTHGIDTVEETAFLTDLLLAPDLPGTVVLATAVRRAHQRDADAPAALRTALTAAADPALRHHGVLVCADGDLPAARWVTTGGHTALTSAPHPPVARLDDGRIRIVGTPPPRPPGPSGQPARDVALIRCYPGIDATLVTAAVDAGAAGIVLEGTGVGNVPVGLLGAVAECTEWGIPAGGGRPPPKRRPRLGRPAAPRRARRRHGCHPRPGPARRQGPPGVDGGPRRRWGRGGAAVVQPAVTGTAGGPGRTGAAVLSRTVNRGASRVAGGTTSSRSLPISRCTA
ncbi:L-asparaginase [Micromonospora yangpuensis]|uniref:L-asparaginase n=1 Tax=Micromonospora yangpuensis TaxID=683228 RepID=A0A1C6UQA9_9ACTN|nr:L-asparaginase [Micromonospora yangpuensis]